MHYLPPQQPNYSQIQQAQQEETRRIQEQLAHQRAKEERLRQEERQRQLEVEMRNRASQTSQRW